METLKLKFTREKETKNTIRYQEELGDVAYSDKEIAIGTLYIQKDVFDGKVPESLLVTVEAEQRANSHPSSLLSPRIYPWHLVVNLYP